MAEQDLSGLVESSGIRGGFVVHVGCGDGKETAGLFRKEGRLVLGLDPDPANVRKARALFLEKECAGRVVAERMTPGRLPLVDGVVNLLIVSEGGAQIPEEEVLRVLAPDGVVYAKAEGAWQKRVKPRPSNIDAWTHFLHGPDNNPVAADAVVDRPFHLRWDGEPRWQRGHDYLASMSALVSDGRKLFYVFDYGETSTMAAPPEWMLVARDAFNGIVLWRRPIEQWEDYLRGFRSGPVHLPRALVATGDRVYTYLSYGGPVVALDPDTGKTLKTFAGTEGVKEILHADGRLYLVLHEGEKTDSYTEIAKRILVLDAASGEILWEKKGAFSKDLNGSTLAVGGGVVVYDARQSLEGVEASTGKELWRVPRIGPALYSTKERSATLISGDTVLWAGAPDKGRGDKGDFLSAFDLKTGKELWRTSAQKPFFSPVEIFVIDGRVWSREGAVKKDRKSPKTKERPGYSVARDLRTGKVLHQRPQDDELIPVSGHGWCYMNKATERYLIRGRTGVDFLSTESDEAYSHQFTRGTCQYGILPCNGLLYVPPHSCACYINAKMNGFLAFSGPDGSKVYERQEPAFEKGDAYGQVAKPGTLSSKDWPTFRADAERSASVDAELRDEPEKTWEVELPGRLSSPVYADGHLYVASIDCHTVYALSGKDGSRIWSCTVGGSIDTPPTVHQGLVIFGSDDGWVYCLRASDGGRVWRFRASEADLRTVSYGQVASVWPVPGSVLAMEGRVYFASGRSSFLDGGMTLYELDAFSGEVLKKKRIYDRDPETGVELVVNIQGNSKRTPSLLPDVLSSDGKMVFLRQAQFDLEFNRVTDKTVPHIFCSVGFADDSWWQRTCQVVATNAGSGFGWGRHNSSVPAGRVLALDGDQVYGFGRTTRYDPFDNFAGLNMKRYHLFAVPKKPELERVNFKTVNWGHKVDERSVTGVVYSWSRDVKVRARSILVAGDKLVLAGPENALYGIKPEALEQGRNAVRDNLASFTGKEGGWLEVASKKDGKTLGRVRLDAPPVYHGLIAADDALFMTTEKGTVVGMK